MNNERREELQEVLDMLDGAIDRIDEIKGEEEDALYNLPDSLQDSSRGYAMQDAMDTLDGFMGAINDIRSEIADFATPKKRPKLRRP